MNDPNVQKAFPMDTAPRDGTMLRLLVQFDDHSTDDTDGPAWTIGYCSKPHPDDDDNWQFAGWCWDHDHFTEGKGTPVGWLPLIDASPKGGSSVRAQFEAWLAPSWSQEGDTDEDGDFVYREDWVQGAWIGYQAAMQATGHGEGVSK